MEQDDSDIEEKLRKAASAIETEDFSARYPALKKKIREEKKPVAEQGNGERAYAIAKSRRNILIAVACVLLVAVIGVFVFLFVTTGSNDMALSDETATIADVGEDDIEGDEKDDSTADATEGTAAEIKTVEESEFYAALETAGIEIADLTPFTVTEYGLITDESGELAGGYVDICASTEDESLSASIYFFVSMESTGDNSYEGYSTYTVGEVSILYIVGASVASDDGTSTMLCESVAWCGELFYEITFTSDTDDAVAFFNLLFS